MAYVKVTKDLNKALKILKGKMIKSRTLVEVRERKEHIKKSAKRRKEIKKATYKERMRRENEA
jgi:ribosomal protein S21